MTIDELLKQRELALKILVNNSYKNILSLAIIRHPELDDYCKYIIIKRNKIEYYSNDILIFTSFFIMILLLFSLDQKI